MFIIELNYIQSITEVERVLPDHIRFLEKHYEKKDFICSGRKNPRTGGIILCQQDSLQSVQDIIKEDPFYTNHIAEYKVIEFLPTKYIDGFERFL